MMVVRFASWRPENSFGKLYWVLWIVEKLAFLTCAITEILLLEILYGKVVLSAFLEIVLCGYIDRVMNIFIISSNSTF